MSVTVVSCIYGNGYDKFIDEWAGAVEALDPVPDEVIVACDAQRFVPGAKVIVRPSSWQHRQAFYLQQAISNADTEWVWIVDIDDIALSDGLEGLDRVAGDVWQMGYRRTDGTVYAPEQLSGRDYLRLAGNPFTAGSAIRTDIFADVGGFSDIAFQDWGLWRNLAHLGAAFEMSGREHYVYRQHQQSRTTIELLADRRTAHEREMATHES